jgi:hypothetical protein
MEENSPHQRLKESHPRMALDLRKRHAPARPAIDMVEAVDMIASEGLSGRGLSTPKQSDHS